MIATLVRNHSKHVQGVEMVGICFDHPGIGVLGLLEPAHAMKRQSFFEGLLMIEFRKCRQNYPTQYICVIARCARCRTRFNHDAHADAGFNSVGGRGPAQANGRAGCRLPQVISRRPADLRWAKA